MTEPPTVRLEFDEDDPNKAAVVAAFQETGLPVYVQPDRPIGTGQRGGGPATGFLVDLLVQHLPAIGDGLIATGVWAALAKAVHVLKGRYGAVRLETHAMPHPTPDEPLPLNVTVVYAIPLDDNQPDLEALGRDLDEVIQGIVESHESQKASGGWVTYTISITRRLRSTDPCRPF